MSDSDTNFVEVQMGGGGPPDDTAVLTPTRLHTSIKPTGHDIGLISRVCVRRHCQMVSVTETPDPSVDVNPFLKEHETGCTSELFQDTENAVVVNFLQAPSKGNAISTSYSQLSFSHHFGFLTIDIQIGPQGSPTPKGKILKKPLSHQEASAIPTASLASAGGMSKPLFPTPYIDFCRCTCTN